MKLSFSMKYWSEMDWPRACQSAEDANLNGLEIDTIKNPRLAMRNSPVNPELATAARRQLAAKDLSIPCIGTAADLMEDGAAGEIAAAIETAANLLVPYVTLHTVHDGYTAVLEIGRASCRERVSWYV